MYYDCIEETKKNTEEENMYKYVWIFIIIAIVCSFIAVTIQSIIYQCKENKHNNIRGIKRIIKWAKCYDWIFYTWCCILSGILSFAFIIFIALLIKSNSL